jgi:hypothetical protein
MAPKAKETRGEKAARLQRKSLELQFSDMRSDLLATTKEKPNLLPQIKDFLKSSGEWPGEGSGASGFAQAPTTSTPTKGTPTKRLYLEDGPDENESAPNPLLIVSVNKNFTKLANMPLVHLQSWLSVLEPISFSAAQLKTLVKRGARDISRQLLSEIYEFILEWDPDAPLFEEGRDQAQMDEWLEKITDSYMKLGRRGQELRIPVDWGRQGFFEAIVKDGVPCLSNRLSKVVVVIPTKYLSDEGGTVVVSKITINMNFSEHRAILIGLVVGRPIRCGVVMAEGSIVAPFAKKPRLEPEAKRLMDFQDDGLLDIDFDGLLEVEDVKPLSVEDVKPLSVEDVKPAIGGPQPEIEDGMLALLAPQDIHDADVSAGGASPSTPVEHDTAGHEEGINQEKAEEVNESTCVPP